MDKMKETFTDATDRVSGSAQGDNQKSYSQQAFDSMRGEKDDQAHGSSTQTMYVPLPRIPYLEEILNLISC
jgi:hypothetical protein